MILLADGGSTKVDWRIIDKGEERGLVRTSGANPYFRTSEDLIKEWKEVLVPFLGDNSLEAVFFYGAGCANETVNQVISQALAETISPSSIEVNSDLLAVARGLCGRQKGIACILGTGSNSCYYDGFSITQQVSPLGYILGDEGSGAVLGRLFVGACLKDQLTKGLKEEFLTRYNITPAEILENVYKQPLPNRYLASFSPFIYEHLSDPSVYKLVSVAFIDFFKRNVMQYDYREYPVHFAGSVAWYYQKLLFEVANQLEIMIGTIVQSPMEGLICFHTIN